MSIFRDTYPRFSPEWVKTWVCSSPQILRPTFPHQKRKKRPEIPRFQVFYGCGGRTRTCGLRVMSCSEAPNYCNAWVSRLFYPRKSEKTRRPNEFAPRPTSGLSRKWVGIWVRADSGCIKKWYTESKKRSFLLCMILVYIEPSSKWYPILPSCEHRVKLCQCIKSYAYLVFARPSYRHPF